MAAPGHVPESINCHACGAPIDLTGQFGFTHIECTRCNALSVVPLKFGEFLLLNPIGIGGVGTVYKAIDLALNRYLAIKILRKTLSASPEFIENFSREARAAAAVSHSNIAQVYSYGEIEGQYYLAMELLERGSLDDRIVKLGKLPEKDVLQIGRQVAAGLRAAQQRGLLHRDIKPGNILFNDDGIPKIVDFGLARAQHESVESEAGGGHAVWGTPYYVAPEKLRGEPEDFRSDMYSLGASLFHALANRPPFEAETAEEIVTKHAAQPAYSLKTYVPTVHDYTAHVIARMLAKTPSERYASYDELIHELETALDALKAAERNIVAPTGESVSIGSVIGTIATLVIGFFVVWFVWKYRVSIFQIESPPPQQTAPVTTAPSQPVTTAAPAAPVGTDVDFNEDAPWAKSWSVATLQLAQGRYNDALFGYESAVRQVGVTRPKHRQWILFYEALTLLAGDRPGEALERLSRIVDPKLKPRVPEEITPTNFIDPLIQTLIGTLPVTELDQAIPRMPAWAAALTEFTVGFKHMQAGEFSDAATEFRAYHKRERDPEQSWAFNLQPLADRLARQCDNAQQTVAEIDKLVQEKEFDRAIETLRAAREKATLTALKTKLMAREQEIEQNYAAVREQLKQERAAAELRRNEEAAREREVAQKDRALLQAAEPAIGALIQRYDFQAARARYEQLTPQMQSASGRSALEQKLAVAKWLTEFKSQLTADVARQPYDRGDLRTRTGVPLADRLVRLNPTQFVFATPYGEVLRDLLDVPPAALVKLADFYATAARTQPVSAQARRYAALAVFCKEFGDERAATFAQQAARLQPALQPELDLALGKTPVPPAE